MLSTLIASFRDRTTELVWNRTYAKRVPPDVQRVAYRKLVMLHRSKTMLDLRVPPGNRLEALTKNRAGQHSIRVNDQWRICFVWKDGYAEHVELTDYH